MYRKQGGWRGKEVQIGSIVHTEVDSFVNYWAEDVGICVMCGVIVTVIDILPNIMFLFCFLSSLLPYLPSYFVSSCFVAEKLNA